MAFTFGGNTANVWQISSPETVGATARAALVCGWWYPTTLTAGRGYWSTDTAAGARVDATTSEIALSTNNVTDGAWVTSGAGIAIDTWHFLAFLLSTSNTGPAAAWRVWRGAGLDAPSEVTVTTVTAPSGNFTGSSTVFVGNRGGGTVSFQGDIGDFAWVTQSATAPLNGPLSHAAYGTVTQAEADLAYQRFVVRLWQGEVFPPNSFYFFGAVNNSSTIMPFDFISQWGCRIGGVTPNISAVSGGNPPVKSGRRCPISLSQFGNNGPNRMRVRR